MGLSVQLREKYREFCQKFNAIEETEGDLIFLNRLKELNVLADNLKVELETELNFVVDFYGKNGGSGKAI